MISPIVEIRVLGIVSCLSIVIQSGLNLYLTKVEGHLSSKDFKIHFYHLALPIFT